jgi:hypothetical protein
MNDRKEMKVQSWKWKTPLQSNTGARLSTGDKWTSGDGWTYGVGNYEYHPKYDDIRLRLGCYFVVLESDLKLTSRCTSAE